jgi:hypothetical protein
MVELKFRFSKFCVALVLAIFFSLLPGAIVYSQQAPSQPPATSTIKGKLASEALSTLGIDRRYDLYFDHALGLLLNPSTSYKLQTWLGEVLAREAGWKKTQAKYIAKLEANFSEAELRDLLKLSQQPVMKKLLRAEIQVYTETSKERRRLLERVWTDYSEGKIPIPDNVLK